MKLLQKTVRSYFIYSLFLLLVAIPAFYLVLQSIVTEDMDEDLVFSKESMKPKIADALLKHDISQLQFLDYDIRISASTHTQPFDSLATIILYDSITGEMVPHRQLTSHFMVNGQPCMLQMTTSLVDKEALIRSIVEVQVILLLLLLAGLFLINRNLSKKIWKPFYRTLDKLRHYNVEQHAPLVLGKSSVNEFNDLNYSLEELTERTYQTYTGQKKFTENAAHEMQTPLAIFQSKVELLMQTTPLNEEQAQLISDLGDATQRMARLNKSLVLLTKIENHQFTGIEDVSVNAVIDHLLEEYHPQIIEKGLHIHRDFQAALSVKANKALIEILVANLLGNAIRHNHTGGSIKILLQQNKLVIQNSGRAAALDEQAIFSRFQKESADSASIGLGLEITKQVCNLYGFSIQYQFLDDLHCFTVHFPVS